MKLNFTATFSEDGILYTYTDLDQLPTDISGLNEWATSLAQGGHLAMYLAQLVEEGLAQTKANSFLLSWSDIYYLHSSEDHADSIGLLDLPVIKKSILNLVESGSLSDVGFTIKINGYIDPQGRLIQANRIGAIFSRGDSAWMVSAEEWRLIDLITDFNKHPPETQRGREAGWGKIRVATSDAHARLSAYLASVIVVTPENLIINYTRHQAAGLGIALIEPTFDGAPDGWLNKFDELSSIAEHIDFSSKNGRLRVIFSEEVRSVLQVIKQEFPGRRAGGVKAEAFIRNPFSYLGEYASKVIDPAQIEQAKENAGIVPTRISFNSNIEKGKIIEVVGLLQQIFDDGTSKTAREKIVSIDDLSELIVIMQGTCDESGQFFKWRSHVVDTDGDTAYQLEQLKSFLRVWQEQANRFINFDDIYGFNEYADRVDKIGVSKPLYSAFIQKEGGDKTPWAPDNLTPLVTVQLTPGGPPVFIYLDSEWINEFKNKIKQAKIANLSSIVDSKLPFPISVSEAEQLCNRLIQMLGAKEPSGASSSSVDTSEFKNESGSVQSGEEKASSIDEPEVNSAEARREHSGKTNKPKVSLLIKTNANQLDYSEMNQAKEREDRLKVPKDFVLSIPSTKKNEIQLLAHQSEGVAWLQHLVSRSPQDCRGAVLADDMGLGKTLQLLMVLAAHYEKNPSSDPSLIVAPVALMKNWIQESKKFFNNFPKILLLHDANLVSLRQPKTYIDKALLEKNISNLLIPNWLGDAKVVLTTYEALRDYEFSLAKQSFSFFICDEAQKIKNPNALVTLAVKKQKANFRIACTGTPVENTLVDLWCLFDFVQPGLLSDLSEFGKKYRQPIESKSDNHEDVRELLKKIIEPQILRRMKEDVADLPPKKYVGNDEYEFAGKLRSRLSINISNYQRALYEQGMKLLKSASNENNAKQRATMSFDVLHMIKAICAEPYCRPRTMFDVDPHGHDVHLFNSPKLKWTLDQLELISDADEKVIIFTELRQIQRAILRFVKHKFGFTPYLINGDTDERQDVVDEFQNKPGFGVIVLSPLAAGFGLNIVSANHVIHFSRTWNPAKEGQATDRAYRIGQTRIVHVYCPTVIANDFVTFEDKLDRIMSTKMDLAGDILDGVGADISFSDLMPDDGPLGAESIHDECVTMAVVDELDGIGFEIFCKVLLGQYPNIARVSDKNKGDGGIDVVVISDDGTGQLCQCKRESKDGLGWDAVKEIVGGRAAYQARHPNIRFQSVAITNRRFNSTARLQASTNGVRLIERDEIAEMLSQRPIKRIVLDEEILRF